MRQIAVSPSRIRITAYALVVCLTPLLPARAQETLAALTRARIDSAVQQVLRKTGAPSASIAVVQDGKLAYAHAYGAAHLTPPVPATSDMRYSIGSVSKQFTATAILLLAEEKKLSLDDKVAKFFPALTRANDITIRHILSMTSGYQDYWPQDYVMPSMLQPTTSQQIVDQWAKKPLDFDPGAKWQYSNTNYVIAGMIVEKVSGMPLLEFLQKRIFGPLHMPSIANIDVTPLAASEPVGYMRYATAPPRPAPKEGKGWLFAAGELAMTARDLAAWDMSMIAQSVLAPASYHTMETDVLLTNGTSTRYGLGVAVNTAGGRRQISHGGEVSGFTARNEVYPDDKAAIVVLANLDATGAPAEIALRIAAILFGAVDQASEKAIAQARSIFLQLQKGQISREVFSANANAYFTPQAIADFASSLGTLGPVTEFTQTGRGLRGGMTYRAFLIRCGKSALTLTTYTLPDGKIEQYQIAASQ